jgi:tetratricopeptide (TPR) repeat protein
MRHVAFLVLVALLLSVTASPVLAQAWAGRGRLQGTVKDEAGNPIEGAKVTLTREGAGPEPFLTNKKGKWSFLGLTNGMWTVSIEFEGYIPSEGTVAANEFGSSPSVNLTLRPIPPEVLAEAAAAMSVELLEKGNQLLQEGKTTEARAEYENALTELEVENHPPVLMGIARTYYQEDNLEQAEATLRKIVEIEPDNVDALKLLSSMLVAQGREEEAKAFMDQLPEGELLDANAYLNVGIDLYNGGQLDEALEEFERVVSNFPELPEAYYYRGLVLLNKGDNAGAAADFEKLIELAPDTPRAAEAHDFLEYLKQGAEGD